MGHLTFEELIDIAEGNAADAAFPHIDSCASCRRQLADLRGAIGSLRAADAGAVPEPPPFFWSQLQHRVADAVAWEAARSPLQRWLSWRAFGPLGAAAAAVALVLGVTVIRRTPPVAPQAPATVVAFEPLEDTFDDDPSLQLVADLAGGLDLADAGDAGLTARDSAEHAVAHMDAQELQELRRLLRAELGS